VPRRPGEPSTSPRALADELEPLLAIAELARTGDDFRPLSETMDLICQRIAGLPACDWVTISLLAEDRRETTAWGDPGIKPEFMEWSRRPRQRHKSSWSPVFVASSSGRPVLVANVFERPEYNLLAEGARIQGFTAAAYIPIMAGGRALGTINCYSEASHVHTESEVAVLQTVARLVGVAAETASIAERQRAGVAEIRRLGAELARRNAELSDLTQAQVALAEALLEPGKDAAQVICEFLAQHFEASTMICAPDGKIRAFAGTDDARVLMSQGLQHRDPMKLALVADGSVNGASSVHRVGHDRLLGLLLVCPPLVEPLHAKTVLLKHAAALLAFEMEAERADRTMRDVARPSVLHALARGSLSAQQAKVAAASIVATGQPLRMAFVRTKSDAVASQLAHRLNRLPPTPSCLVAAPEGEGVLFLLEDGPAEEVRHSTGKMLEQTAQDDWAVGLSGQFSEMTGAFVALEQARMVSNLSANQRTLLYEDLGPTTDLLRQLTPSTRAAFIEKLLGPLLAYDRSRRAGLVASVAAYLRHRGSLRAASQELAIHPNTLQLRLGRAASLTGLDFHDPLQLGLLALAINWNSLLQVDAGRDPATAAAANERASAVPDLA
jgi:hypothetical protein